jgi:predicted RNase H-like HicB family nuclease
MGVTVMGISAPMLIQFRMKIPAEVRREGNWFISRSPNLDVYSQGRTERESLENLIEALQLFMESCFERGVLEQVLKDCGFRPVHDIHAADVSPHREDRYVDVDVPLSLVANAAANHAC